jgi:hypothetical protein
MSTNLKIKDAKGLKHEFYKEHLGDRADRVGLVTIKNKPDGWSTVTAWINDRKQELTIESDNDMDEVIDWVSNELENKNEWYFTFGVGHAHPMHYVTVAAYSSGQARNAMIEKFGIKWAFQYDTLDDVSKYGYKELKRLEVEDE